MKTDSLCISNKSTTTHFTLFSYLPMLMFLLSMLILSFSLELNNVLTSNEITQAFLKIL